MRTFGRSAATSLAGTAILLAAAAVLPWTAEADPPGLAEYRVYATIVLDLGPGVQGGVEATGDPICVNANGEFPFSTTGDIASDTHALWIDASESVVPPCFATMSSQRFRVYTTSPYTGEYQINFFEKPTGQTGRSPYHLECYDGVPRHLGCTQRDDLTIVITCADVFRSPCPRHEETPGQPVIPGLPGTGSAGS